MRHKSYILVNIRQVRKTFYPSEWLIEVLAVMLGRVCFTNFKLHLTNSNLSFSFPIGLLDILSSAAS